MMSRLIAWCICASWWRHGIETYPRCWDFVRGIQSTGGFPSQRPVTRSFDVFFHLRLNKRLSKQSRRLWFETPSRSLWRHCNGCFWCVLLFRSAIWNHPMACARTQMSCHTTISIRCQHVRWNAGQNTRCLPVAADTIICQNVVLVSTLYIVHTFWFNYRQVSNIRRTLTGN